MQSKIGRMFLNTALALACAIGVAGLIAGVSGTAQAQTGYDNCPAGTSRKAVLWGGMQAGMPSSCRLSQCKPYNPPAYDAKFVNCALFPGAPAAGQGPTCMSWMYQVQAAAAPATFCPTEVQNGGTTGWLYQ